MDKLLVNPFLVNVALVSPKCFFLNHLVLFIFGMIYVFDILYIELTFLLILISFCRSPNLSNNKRNFLNLYLSASVQQKFCGAVWTMNCFVILSLAGLRYPIAIQCMWWLVDQLKLNKIQNPPLKRYWCSLYLLNHIVYVILASRLMYLFFPQLFGMQCHF